MRHFVSILIGVVTALVAISLNFSFINWQFWLILAVGNVGLNIVRWLLESDDLLIGGNRE